MAPFWNAAGLERPSAAGRDPPTKAEDRSQRSRDWRGSRRCAPQELDSRCRSCGTSRPVCVFVAGHVRSTACAAPCFASTLPSTCHTDPRDHCGRLSALTALRQRVIDAEPDMTVVATLGDGVTALEEIRRLLPEVAVLVRACPGSTGSKSPAACPSTTVRARAPYRDAA